MSHHLHVWELDEHHIALEAHVVISDAGAEQSELRQRLKRMLEQRFNIGHSTLEFEGIESSQQCDDQDLLHRH